MKDIIITLIEKLVDIKILILIALIVGWLNKDEVVSIVSAIYKSMG